MTEEEFVEKLVEALYDVNNDGTWAEGRIHTMLSGSKEHVKQRLVCLLEGNPMPNVRINLCKKNDGQARADLYVMTKPGDSDDTPRHFYKKFDNCCCIRGASRQALEFLKSLDWKPAKKQPR
jgi:hypothetical protein